LSEPDIDEKEKQMNTNVDLLGKTLAQIADLTKVADAIKDGLKDQATSLNGDKVFEGEMFKATVVEADRKVVDYKAMLKDLGVSEDTIRKYTSVTAVFSVKTTSR
jgi:hypothetical protein